MLYNKVNSIKALSTRKRLEERSKKMYKKREVTVEKVGYGKMNYFITKINSEQPKGVMKLLSLKNFQGLVCCVVHRCDPVKPFQSSAMACPGG